jgi:hypothetical protein
MPEFFDAQLVSDVYEGDRKDKALSLFKDADGRIVSMISDAVDERMMELGIAPKRARRRSKWGEKIGFMRSIFDNGGVNPMDGLQWEVKDFQAVDRTLVDKYRSGELKEFNDTLFTESQPLLFPQVVSNVVREAAEPQMVLGQLMQTINHTQGSSISFPAVSSYTAGDLRIVEGGEYPEGNMQFAGQIVATIGKHGIKVSMTEEVIRYSAFDVWSMHLRAAGMALGRHKEMQIVDEVLEAGSDFFDNTLLAGNKTTGRDQSGAFNGTFTQDDMFDMWADLVQSSYIPDTIIMHPFAWPIFARDPVLRNLGYLSGTGQSVIGNPFSGSVATRKFDVGGLNQDRRIAEPMNTATTFSQVPRTFPFGPLRIIISPFVDYDRTNNSTTIYLADSADLGAIVVDEGIMTEDWTDPEHDIKNVKFRERYSVVSTNQGRAVRKAVGVVVTKSYDWSLSSLVHDISAGSLPTSEYLVS